MLVKDKNLTELEEIQDLRSTFAGGAEKDRNAYLGSIKRNSKGVYTLAIQGGGPCHGAFQGRLETLSGSSYLLSSVQSAADQEKILDLWTHYLANESPFAEAFVSKDVADIKKYGWVIRTDMSQNFIGNACIATRFVTEKYSQNLSVRHKVFNTLREAGYDIWESYLFCHIFSFQSGKWPLTVSPHNGGHTIFTITSFDKVMLKSALEANFVGKDPTLFKDFGGYRHGTLNTIWGYNKHGNIADRLLALKPRQKTVKVNHNIFEKKPVGGYAINDIDQLRDVVEQIKGML